jgi:hypothetical protein
MRLNLKGKSKFLSKAEIKFALGYFAHKLMGARLPKSLEIDLVFEDMTGVADGYCHPFEAGRNPRSFEISINSKLPRHMELLILAHEMVHVKQYARNELKSDNPESASFAGKVYSITSSLEDYLDYPWEIEAFGREKGLYTLYQILLKQEKIKFRNGKMYMRGKYFKIKEK